MQRWLGLLVAGMVAVACGSSDSDGSSGGGESSPGGSGGAAGQSSGGAAGASGAAGAAGAGAGAAGAAGEGAGAAGAAGEGGAGGEGGAAGAGGAAVALKKYGEACACPDTATSGTCGGDQGPCEASLTCVQHAGKGLCTHKCIFGQASSCEGGFGCADLWSDKMKYEGTYCWE